MIVGLGLLVLLIFLSPLGVIVAALVFGVSIIALIIRVAQRGSIRGWGIAAIASVVLMFTFGAMSDVLYGTGFTGGIGSGSLGAAQQGFAPTYNESKAEHRHWMNTAYDYLNTWFDQSGPPEDVALMFCRIKHAKDDGVPSVTNGMRSDQDPGETVREIY